MFASLSSITRTTSPATGRALGNGRRTEGADQVDEGIRVELRLLSQIGYSPIQALLVISTHRFGRQDDDRDSARRFGRSQTIDDREAVELGHEQIEDDQRWSLAFRQAKALFSTARLDHLITLRLEDGVHEFKHDGIVIN